MFELKVSSVTAGELAHLVNSLAGQFGVTIPKEPCSPPKEVETVEAEKIETPKEEKKTKAKKGESVKADHEAVATTIQEVGEDPKSPPEDAPTLTKQDIADACQKVSQTKSLDAAKAILAKFNNEKGEACRRISDIKVFDYASFIAECEKAVA